MNVFFYRHRHIIVKPEAEAGCVVGRVRFRMMEGRTEALCTSVMDRPGWIDSGGESTCFLLVLFLLLLTRNVPLVTIGVG